MRFTDILLNHTETISVSGETLAGKKEKFTFKIPTLPAFIFAKGLIFAHRGNPDKRVKDLAYILETLKRPVWRKTVVEGLPRVAAKHPAGWYRTFKRQLDSAFVTEGSTGPAWVALEYPERVAAEMRGEAFKTFREFLHDL